MCKVKPYSKEMQKYLDSVLLRLDTYFLYDEYQKQAKVLQDLSNGIASEIPFDEIIEQQIDVDNLSYLNDLYLNKILGSNLIKLSNADFGGGKCDVFVNTYFIAFLIKPNEGVDPNDAIAAIRDKYLLDNNQPLQYTYLRLNYSVSRQKPETLWKICDRSAFPIIRDTEFSGSYTDSIEEDGVDIDLGRSISPSEPKSKELDINIQSKAVVKSSNFNSIADDIINIVKLSEKEITRCFAK